MQQSNLFLFGKQVQAKEVDKGVTRKILGYDRNLMMVSVEFLAGSIGSEHTHPHVQSTYVVSGKFEVTIGDKKQVLCEGDGFFIPSGLPHGVKCLEAGILIDVFNPVREDFL